MRKLRGENGYNWLNVKTQNFLGFLMALQILSSYIFALHNFEALVSVYCRCIVYCLCSR